MKRIFLALLVTLLVAGVCMAQTVWEQQGMASQVMQTGGMSAAHPSLPIGSNVRVINTATNDEIEVTITGRIVPAVDRIIDLSPVAAQALGISGSGHVMVTTASPPLPQPIPPPLQEPPVFVFVAEPEPIIIAVSEPVIATLPEPVVAAQEPIPPQPVMDFPLPQQPITITIHNYIVVPDNTPAERRERPMRQHRGPRAAVPLPPDFQPLIEPVLLVDMFEEDTVLYEPPHELISWSFEPLIDGVTLIPGLPDPHTDKMYRLQVGAYSGTGSASITMRAVESAGFIAVQERYGNLFRVFVDEIPSRNVQSAVQRLAALGFTQIWVRE
ncbi:MAG: hypothetical protein FWB78_01460 [Treponema sp.]|nr:hypothetical protein [Treponema sp.]